MREQQEGGQKKEYVFPLERNKPIAPEIVVREIGGFARKFFNDIAKVSDFPQRVRVEKVNGEIIETVLVNLYSDRGSQADGTFYFSDRVRTKTYGRSNENDDYLFGVEIKSIIFV